MKHPHALKTALAAFALAAAGLALAPLPAAAAPFFFGAPSLFEPEISIVNSGAINDVQATVSHDRRYVTLNMRPALSNLLALREFQFQGNGGGGDRRGFVGGVVGDAGGGGGDVAGGARIRAATNRRSGRAAVTAVHSSPAEVRRRATQSQSVLEQRGMTRVD